MRLVDVAFINFAAKYRSSRSIYAHVLRMVDLEYS